MDGVGHGAEAAGTHASTSDAGTGEEASMGANTNGMVMVLAATNFPWDLDKALK